MVLALVEYSVVILMGRASETTDKKVRSTTMAIPTTTYIQDQTNYVPDMPTTNQLYPRILLEKKKEQYSTGKGLPEIHKQIKNERPGVFAGKWGNYNSAAPSINSIDFISFWLFSIFFVVFNIGYWSY